MINPRASQNALKMNMVFSFCSTIGTISRARRVLRVFVDLNASAAAQILGGQVVAVDGHLYPLHHQIQQTIHRLLHICRRARGRLKVGQSKKMESREKIA